MNTELKSVGERSIPRSLHKAHQYRLLGESLHAESICRDVLEVDRGNQQAMDQLLLALTDQFDSQLEERFREAMSIRERLADPFRRKYLKGLILERHAMALLRRGGPGADMLAYDGLRRAMRAYEDAQEVNPAGNEDAILRWNTCVRIIRRSSMQAAALQFPLQE